MSPTVSPEHERDVEILAERLAMLYRHFAQAIVDELGEERGRALVSQAVTAYGQECGTKVRSKVGSMGEDLSIANYALGKDLPSVGWSLEVTRDEPGIREVKISRCPLAQYWIAQGCASLGRLYCLVDPSKYSAYKEGIQCSHPRNVLDGDEWCVMRIEEPGSSA
ncbi:MAG: L-2-amino-thiazoline-4-carboxylic acid hydrolase [Bacillota bacterium]